MDNRSNFQTAITDTGCEWCTDHKELVINHSGKQICRIASVDINMDNSIHGNMVLSIIKDLVEQVYKLGYEDGRSQDR